MECARCARRLRHALARALITQNRQKVAQFPIAKAASSKVLPSRATGRGRGRGDSRFLAKDSCMESSMKQQELSIPEIFKTFSIRFVRLHGILFTRTSLETFGDVFSSVTSDLLELLSAGTEEVLNFGVDATENGLVIVRLISMLIFTVHNVNRDSGGQTYAEILQRSALLQNAFTASFEFVGHVLKRCIDLRDVASSFLLPGIMVFIEWLACHRDIAVGFDIKEKEVSARIYFWDQWVAFMNALLSSGHGYIDMNEDETCFSDMSHYDEEETGNRLALWEDFELRGFHPLVQAHLILDFSSKHSIGGDGSTKEKKARVQRIFAAGRALMNVVRIDQRVIYFDRLLKKFLFGIEPPAFISDMHADFTNVSAPKVLKDASSIESASNLGGSQSSVVDFGLTPVEAVLNLDGEDEEEEIVFKPIITEKFPNMPTYSPSIHTHLSNDLNATTQLKTSIPDLSPQPLQNLNFSTSKWFMEKETMLSDGLNDMKIANGLMFQGGFGTYHPSTFVPPASSISNSSFFSNQLNVSDAIIPSPLDSIVLPSEISNGLPERTSTVLPTMSKRNPVSRPVRHFGPPPGFTHASSRPEYDSFPNLATKDPQLHVDDYSWLDGYQPSSTKGFMDTFTTRATVMHPHSCTNINSTYSGITSFPFPGKQTSLLPTMVNNVDNEKWQDFQLFEHLNPYAEQHLTQTNMRPVLLPKQHQAQSIWSDGYLV
ncbi:Protein SMG7 [Platanthera guangdongensis]|uniref:Protein SMG7 n=1 Tax=Platanthera guangdongensis TaxID=2320717 RepID=A0ABR2LI61_9ASPA